MTGNDLSSLQSNYYYKPFTSNIAGFIVPMITGLLSACSSGLIIYIISNSQQKLSTTYHRIMAFMSGFDIISSIFIALLGTIMLPSDTMYKFAGPMMGTKVTCQIQGWFIIFGLCGNTSLNACLVWYFVLKITFKIRARTIERCVEPIMYCYALTFTLLIPTFFLTYDLINPHVYDGFCIIAPYPQSCDDEMWYDWHNCTWSEGVIERYLKYSYVPIAGVGKEFILVVIGSSFILWTVVRNKKEMKDFEAHQRENDSNHSLGRRRGDEQEEEQGEVSRSDDNNIDDHIGTSIDNNIDIEDLKFDRVLIIQSLMYVAAFCMTCWMFIFFQGGSTLLVSNWMLSAVSCFRYNAFGTY